ncbi:MAG: helix-turn-helix domain-containing protein [Chloroflexi bacterium]|nr:helix-turn-helix domain-containing protein [Chloroflexota bacterium]
MARTTIAPSTFDELQELEFEMESQGRTSKAKALREAMLALARPARGWITTGQAAERLGITIPTVKAWISRGALIGRQVGDRWWVSTESVEDVLSFGRGVAELEEDGLSAEDEVREVTGKIRHQMGAEKRASIARE